MHLINLIVYYLNRKYGILLHIFFFENWTSGTSHLKPVYGYRTFRLTAKAM